MRHAHAYPVINSWYWDVDHADQFEIIDTDDENGLIDVQFFTGEIEEMDMDEWFSLRLVAIADPIDWSGPYEVDRDEFADLDDEVIHPPNYSDPFDQIEPEPIRHP